MVLGSGVTVVAGSVMEEDAGVTVVAMVTGGVTVVIKIYIP